LNSTERATERTPLRASAERTTERTPLRVSAERGADRVAMHTIPTIGTDGRAERLSTESARLGAAAGEQLRAGGYIGEQPKRLTPLLDAAAVGRFVVRCPWPELDIPAKDAQAFQSWCFNVEGLLSEAFPDARCPYNFLDPCRRGPEADDIRRKLSAPWRFRDFMDGCDFADDAGFEDWCRARRDRQIAVAQQQQQREEE